MELVMIIGNIGSGKTTKAKEYIENGYICITRDGLRYAIGGGIYIYNPLYEDLIFSCTFDIFDKFIKRSANIVIDESNVSRDLRRKYIKKAKKEGYKIIGIEMPRYIKETCVNRRLKDPHGSFTDRETWEIAWDFFDRIYEPLNKKEGFDKIIRL